MFRLILIGSFFLSYFSAQQVVSGKILDENGNGTSSVLVVNINSGMKTESSLNGDFRITANINDELRFAKKGYDRSAVKISTKDFNENLIIKLTPAVIDVGEVRISKKSNPLEQSQKIDQINKLIGVPNAPEKPRAKPAEVVDDVLLPLLTANLNIQAIYDLASGKARRMKHLYAHEDFQSDVHWIRSQLDDEFFTQVGIPKEKIHGFIEFAFRENPEIRKKISAKNFTSALLLIDEITRKYLEQTKVK